MENKIKEYLKHFGKEIITKEIEEYAVEEALKHSRYIFTERRGRKQYGYCTYCKNEFETDGLKHKKSSVCPHCRSEVQVRASGRGRKYMFDESYFVYFEKSKIDKDVIIAKGIAADKSYKGDYKESTIRYYIKALYIFEINNPVMLINQYWGNDIENFRKAGSIYPVTINSINCMYLTNLNSLDKAVENTPYNYSMYREYTGVSGIIKYLGFYSKYPKIEDLTKLGFKELVIAKLWGSQTYSSVNWKGDTVFKMLKVNRAGLKELRGLEGRKSTLFIKLYQLNSKEKNKLSLEELKKIERQVERDYTSFRYILRYTSLYKANKYINKQEKAYVNKFYRGLLGVITDWKDYIEDCKKLKMDITKESVLFPKDLYKAHQNTIKQVKYQADKLLDEKMKKREEEINKKYYFEDKNYIIRAAKSTQEMIDEGKTLIHCVGGYVSKHAKGETNILFIREKENIDKPYYTMEIKNNRIVQVRGFENDDPGKKLNKFINKFKALKIEKVKSKKIA